MRGRPLANLAGIFGKSPITTIMQVIFNGPLLTVQFQQQSRISLLGGETGDAIDDLLRTLEGMFYPST